MNLRQLFSSSPSEQSLLPSHTASAGIHFPSWQSNLLEGQPQFSSSDWSLHTRSPSHLKSLLTHSPLLHWNCFSPHWKPEKFIKISFLFHFLSLWEKGREEKELTRETLSYFYERIWQSAHRYEFENPPDWWVEKKRKGLVAIVITCQPVVVDYWQTKCAPQA